MSCYGRDYTLIHNSKENKNIIVQRYQGYLKKNKDADKAVHTNLFKQIGKHLCKNVL